MPVLPAALPLALLTIVLVPVLVPAARGGRPPWWRTLAGVVAVAVLAWACCAPLDRGGWPGALAVGVTTAVVPLLLAAADPVAGWRAVLGGRPRLDGPVARFVMFPLVAGVVSAAALTAVYLAGAVDASTGRGPRADAAWLGVQAVALGVGVLVALPLLTDDLLPAWVTPPVKAGLAALDGVVDAVPGIVVMTTRDWVVGQTLLAVAEAVALPVMLWVAVGWARHDAATAREVDARLDADADADDGTPWWER